MAGAAFAIPATSALASPSSIALNPGSRMINVSQAAGPGGVFRAHTVAATVADAQAAAHKPGADVRFRAPHIVNRQFRPPHEVNTRAAQQPGEPEQRWGPLRSGSPWGPLPDGSGSPAHRTLAGLEPASAPMSDRPGLLLEPNGTFVTLARSATNVHTAPAGSLIITPDGAMVSPPVGTYATIYGLIIVTPAPGSPASPVNQQGDLGPNPERGATNPQGTSTAPSTAPATDNDQPGATSSASDPATPLSAGGHPADGVPIVNGGPIVWSGRPIVSGGSVIVKA